jgi:hypothetical protein
MLSMLFLNDDMRGRVLLKVLSKTLKHANKVLR